MTAGRAGEGAEERLRRQRAVLADFGLFAFRARELDELLDEAVELVSQAMDVKLVKILEWRPERDDFLIRAGVNWKPGVVGHATIAGHSRSPGGYALEREEPVISPDLSAETRFEIPEILREHGVRSMVNVVIPGETAPFGVLEVDASERRDFSDDDIAFLRNYANLLAAAVDRQRAHQELAETSEARRKLVRELQHRVKNILALAQSLAMLTSTSGRTADGFREAFLGRLQALSRAHALVSEEHRDDVELGVLVERVTEPHRADRQAAVTTEGPPVKLAAKQGLMLGLMLHELATNAVKYGALSAPEGQVNVSWRLGDGEAGEHLQLFWHERGGPPVQPPATKGFGTTMIERAGSYDLDGRARIVHAPDGLRCEIEFPLPRNAAEQGNPHP